MNEALKHLGEEHRLGMIRTDEFRSRRRNLLESWGDLEATTSPGGSTRPSMSTTQTNPGRPQQTAAAEPPRGKNWALIGVVALAVIAAAVGGWLLVHSSKPPEGNPDAGAQVAKRSPALAAAMREATAFRNRNSWEEGDVQAFLEVWRGLLPAERRAAQQEPALRSLLFELEQNIAAEQQALEFSPSPEGRARLERLQAFADELTEIGS